jgi:glyoxylase-like metal-dependent hydrolase (beta-lactamase superfamily II)
VASAKGHRNESELQIVSFTQGPAATNAYLLGDDQTGEAIVIDPAWDGGEILAAAAERNWRIIHIWLTHAHFDHLGGAAEIFESSPTPIPVALHPADHPLWQVNGGAAFFGIPDFDPGPEPTVDLDDGMELRLGSHQLSVHHTPGHTPGHVVFAHAPLAVVFCGDLIFQGSVGRVDLPGGDRQSLLDSIRRHILTLPDDTQLLPGHGPATTVARERQTNPFLVNDW